VIAIDHLDPDTCLRHTVRNEDPTVLERSVGGMFYRFGSNPKVTESITLRPGVRVS
jgi:hypothetical protein